MQSWVVPEYSLVMPESWSFFPNVEDEGLGSREDALEVQGKICGCIAAGLRTAVSTSTWVVCRAELELDAQLDHIPIASAPFSVLSPQLKKKIRPELVVASTSHWTIGSELYARLKREERAVLSPNES